MRLLDVSFWTALALLFVLGRAAPATAQSCGLTGPPLTLASTPLTEATKGEARAFLGELRQRFPDHVQGAFQKPISTQRTAVAVTEPPPHATPEAIQRRLGASFVEVVQRRVGHDGWSKDVVAIVDHQDSAVLADAIVRLDAYFYGTSYRADFGSSESRRAFKVSGLDVGVSPTEIRSWILGSDVRFASLDGRIAVDGNDLRTRRAQGVFRTVEPGFVVWAVPPKADLCEHQAELREFTLEGDLVLGAVATTQHVLFVARERRVSPEKFPPLRSESVLALAAAGTPQLAQSYQRLALYSGKLRSGKDWAPILLSDVLQGTDFGSLLNLTDQMLKSWSLNGAVKYDGFESYPNPDHWAAAQPIDERLNTETLTFNWNTSGTTALTQDSEAQVISVLRTGALPITYIPENTSDTRIAELEASYHDYFATLGNPDLARVVAYTVMYEALRVFELKASCYKAGSGERQGETVLTSRAAGFVAAVQRQDAALAKTASKALGPNGPALLAQAKQFFDAIEQRSGKSGLEELVFYLASVRGPSGIEKPTENLITNAQRLATDPAFSQLTRGVFDRDEVLAHYLAQARPSEGRWLRTPTVVLSKMAGADGVYVEGGHNVDVRPFEVVPDEQVPRQKPRIDTSKGHTRLRIHPDDSAVVSRLMPVMKKIEDKRIPVATAEAELASLAKQLSSNGPRSPSSALWPAGEPPYWPGRSTLGWSSSRRTATDAPRPSGNRIRIERKQNGYELWLPGHEAPKVAGSPVSLAEGLNTFIAESGQANVVLELVGMRDEQARVLRQTLRVQIRRILAENKGKAPASVEIQTGTPRGVPAEVGATSSVVTVTEPRAVPGEAGTMYECVLEIRDKTVLVQLQVAMKQRITAPVRETLKRLAQAELKRKTRQAATDAARAIRDVVKRDYRDVAVDVLVRDGAACNHVIANR